MAATGLIDIDDRTNTFSSGRTDLSKFRAEITIASWSGKRVEIKLSKRAGFETADVLSEEEGDDNNKGKGGLGSTISSYSVVKRGKRIIFKLMKTAWKLFTSSPSPLVTCTNDSSKS